MLLKTLDGRFALACLAHIVCSFKASYLANYSTLEKMNELHLTEVIPKICYRSCYHLPGLVIIFTAKR